MAIVPENGFVTGKAVDGKLKLQFKTNMKGVVYEIELQGEGCGEVDFDIPAMGAIKRIMGEEPDESGWRPTNVKKAKRKYVRRKKPEVQSQPEELPPEPPTQVQDSDPIDSTE